MTIRMGFQAKLYRNTGSYGTPVWDEIPLVKENTLNDSMSEADITNRIGAGFKLSAPGLRDVGIEFDMPNIVADVDLLAMRVLYDARTPVELACMDGPIATAGSHGLRATCCLFQRNRDEAIDGAQMVSWTAKPTEAANAPSEMLIV